MRRHNITEEDLKNLSKCLQYDPSTGSITWKAHQNPATALRVVGKPAFSSFDIHGYGRGMFLGKKYRAHQIAFAMYHGKWSQNFIDHINGNRKDNRILNLREVSSKENSMNRCTKSNYGCHGIQERTLKDGNKSYHVSITVDGKRHYIGTFHDLDEARDARHCWEMQFGFHTNHGRPMGETDEDLLC